MTRSVEIPEAAVARAAQKLRDEGGEPGHGIHSWRCEHPDRYGACDCVEVTARAMLEAAALPYLAPAAKCTCDPGPEGQHRYWCATYGPHNCTEHRVTALDGEGQSLGYTHCGICGEPEQTEEERGFVEIALAAVDAGNAGSWPTVAGYLADEVRRLRSEAVRPLPTREQIDKLVSNWFRATLAPEVRDMLADAIEGLFSGGEE